MGVYWNFERDLFRQQREHEGDHRGLVEAMLPYFGKHYGNARAFHISANAPERRWKVPGKDRLVKSKLRSEEIIFTSGGSESKQFRAQKRSLR